MNVMLIMLTLNRSEWNPWIMFLLFLFPEQNFVSKFIKIHTCYMIMTKRNESAYSVYVANSNIDIE